MTPRKRFSVQVAIASAALLTQFMFSGPVLGDGKALYTSQCAICHQTSGKGAPGLYPPLVDRLWPIAANPAGREYLVSVILYGLVGPIDVDGARFSGLMLPFRHLTDGQITEILNYSITDLGAPPRDFQPFTAAEIGGPRAVQKTSQQVHTLRTEALDQAGGRRSEIGPAPGLPGTVPRITGTIEDYVRQCQGCHGVDGRGAPPAVPRLVGSMGYFARSPEGRAYLVRVPGVANAPLDDSRLAALLNWSLETYGGTELPAGFRPFTAGEVGQLRARRLTTPAQTRRDILSRLQQDGLIDNHLADDLLDRKR